MAMECPRTKIKVVDGLITIKGKFRMRCQGRKCLDFPCKDYSEHRERAALREE